MLKDKPQPIEIFVFGSNRQGRHGKGAALEAMQKWGAIYGQAEGRQGNSYAIVTKELRMDQPRVTLREVIRGVDRFIDYATLHPELQFVIMAIGCGLAGFIPKQIAPLFQDAPSNCRLPEQFIKVLCAKG